jgi:DNA-binding MarR family transcriptional regulator
LPILEPFQQRLLREVCSDVEITKLSRYFIIETDEARCLAGLEAGVNNEPAAAYERRLSTAVRRLDLALAEWHGSLSDRMRMGTPDVLALAELSMDEPLGPSELAERLHITTGATTPLLDRLTARGHVVRESHPTDRRRVLLRLTDNARADARRQVQPMMEEMRALSESYSPAERETIAGFVEALATIVARQGSG